MKGLGSRSAVVVVTTTLMLFLLPAAVALADTIKSGAGVQFSGVVDSFPVCSDTTAAISISWGDGGTSPGARNSSGAVTGTHTYAAAGTYNGTINFSGGTGTCTPANGNIQDTLTANVGPAPQFKQCPPVGADSGCQFVIVISGNGTTILQDTNQGPYESAEDALIGVQNNSSSPISSIPIHVAGSPIFGFEQDGLCNPGSPPVPSGCVPPPGAAAGTTCNGSGNCAFPAPPGQPPGYIEPGAPSGTTQNGYEGPTSWFSNVSSDTTSGRVNFSPPIPPGQSTYFSLEEPPSASALAVHSTPGNVVSFPPTVTTNGARFSGNVNPNGASTTAWYQYGLDARYTTPGKSGPVYDKQTTAQPVGGDFSTHTFSQSVSNLVPNALYHFRLVAKNADGTTFGADQTFTTKKDPLPPPPVLGKSEDVAPVSGLVLIKAPPGKSLYAAADGSAAAVSKGQGFIPLTEARRIPVGSQIDARRGSLAITAAAPVRHGKLQKGTFNGGLYRLTQAKLGLNKGLTSLSLLEGAFRGAPSYASCPKRAADGSARIALSAKVLQTLKGNARGKFRTVGRYAAATVRGTNWGVADRCDGTLTTVRRGTVEVSDFVRHVSVIVHAGHQYLAKKK
jgi:hypothetical protein